MIALSLLPNVFVLAKVEKDVPSENYTTLAIDPYYINALTSKAVTLGSLGNYTGAIEYYDKALTIQPNDSYALDNKGLAFDNLGNHTGAIEYYDKALTINPKYEAALDNNTFLHEVNESFSGNNIYLHAKVAVNGFEVRSDIALTGQQQAKGLDIKNNLTENQGMLFVFQQPYRYGFWMMGVKFPIDII
ncbi:MAG: tetratricopeptide repeat protein [Candidatus Nitrosopolaris sp.]